MTQLPTLLEPWRPWLSLFPVDLSEPLGQLLLRLNPQVGPLRSAPARNDSLPEGVGSIVSRGKYERLLISEWAYADAEPDEFIRRAASGELMFTGPEPAARQRSRRCVALFDAGPAQLGEPRLLHLALFILLARRAEEAGAVFEWGILQEQQLSDDSGKEGIRKLIQSRTLAGVAADAVAAWRDRIDADTDDVWIIGGPRLPAPFPARAHVGIRRQLLGEQLDVTITMHRSTHTVTLALPPTALGVRLLRTPFDAVASRARKHQGQGRPSLQQPPRFGAFGRFLAVAQLDGGVHVHPVPRSTKNVPGNGRRHAAPAKGSILGAGLFGQSLGTIVAEGDTLRLSGFPSETLGGKTMTCERPPAASFRAPPKMGRWLQIFFGRNTRKIEAESKVEEATVIALDLDGNLGCWSRRATKQAGVTNATPLAFRLLAQDVIGAVQFGEKVLFASCGKEGNAVLFEWSAKGGSSHLALLSHKSTQIFFGHSPSWAGQRSQGLAALKISATGWVVWDGRTWVSITITDNVTVLGVAKSAVHATIGLVVLRNADRMTIELRSHADRKVLVQSPEPIAQASLCPATGDIAWIGAKTLSVTVRGIDQHLPFLQVIVNEAAHEE